MTQTIQLTSKKLKGQLLASGAAIVIGGVSTIAGACGGCDTITMVGALMFVAGIGGWIVTKVRIWWHHQ